MRFVSLDFRRVAVLAAMACVVGLTARAAVSAELLAAKRTEYLRRLTPPQVLRSTRHGGSRPARTSRTGPTSGKWSSSLGTVPLQEWLFQELGVEPKETFRYSLGCLYSSFHSF